MKNSVLRFMFSVLDWKYPFLINLFQKTNFFVETQIYNLFLFLMGNTLFALICCKNSKIVNLTRHFVSRLFWICKMWCCVHFSCFRSFLQVLSKKFIWHIHITRLISQQFTGRDLNPVAFLVVSAIKRKWEIKMLLCLSAPMRKSLII